MHGTAVAMNGIPVCEANIMQAGHFLIIHQKSSPYEKMKCAKDWAESFRFSPNITLFRLMQNIFMFKCYVIYLSKERAIRKSIPARLSYNIFDFISLQL